MSSFDFAGRVRERAYDIWEREGRPTGRAEGNWREAERIEARTHASVDVRSSFESLQFKSELAEIYLLVDFISGRPDIGFRWNSQAGSEGSAIATASASANDTGLAVAKPLLATNAITEDELTKLVAISYPSRERIANANDAAFVLTFRDKLNRLVWPANGLSIAFTLLIWTPPSLFHRLLSVLGPWFRDEKLLEFEKPRWTLAKTAYPRLTQSVQTFRLSTTLLFLLAICVIWVSSWTSQEVVNGQAMLSRVQALEQRQAGLISSLEQMQGVTSTPFPASTVSGTNVQYDQDGRMISEPSLTDIVCQPAKQIGAAAAGSAASTDALRNPQEYETCYQLLTVNLELDLAQKGLQYWWKTWNQSVMLKITRVFSPSSGAVPEIATSGNKSDFMNFRSSYSVLAAKLAEMASVWLPMLYGFIGAIVAALRRIYSKISASTLAPWDTRLIWTRVLLGAMAGTFIGLFFAPTGNGIQDLPGIGTLSLSAIAFLAGYAVDGLFALLDEIIQRVFRPGADAVAKR